MFAFALGRVLQLMVAVVGASIVVFIAVRLSGDPTYMLLPDSATPAQVAEYRHALGLDRPLLIQYLEFASNLARGQLGYSFTNKMAVADLIAERLPVTLVLICGSLIPALLVSIPLGVLSAVRHGRLADHAIQFLSTIGLAMPSFWIGLLLIQFVALPTGLFPTGGSGSWKHFVLPSLTLGLFLLAPVVRLTRSGMLDALGEDYIRTARAKGLPERLVVYRHALRNTSLPLVTIVGLQLGALLGGVVIIEYVFSLAGVGRLILEGISNRDFPLVQSTVVILALIFGVLNLVVDLLYGFLDPRIRFA